MCILDSMLYLNRRTLELVMVLELGSPTDKRESKDMWAIWGDTDFSQGCNIDFRHSGSCGRGVGI